MATLRWPLLTPRTHAGNGGWLAEVLLMNDSPEPVRLTGGPMARGVLRHPDDNPVKSRQEQPWPMPASTSIHQLAPDESVSIPVALSRMCDELAALPVGLYSITGVTSGELTASDVAVEITARPVSGS
jgi:hypothetical protein